MTDIAKRIVGWSEMPPEPEWRDDGAWWYKGGRYYQHEAFREYNDDRCNALRERLRDTAEVLERCCEYWQSETPIYDGSQVSLDIRAILEALRKEGLIP